MRRLFVLLLTIIVFISGCSVHVINYESVNSIVDTVLYKKTNLVNTNFEGYSFYLPQGTKIVDKSDYNLKIKDHDNYYYLYVDTIAYHYQTNNVVTLDESHFYTNELSKDDFFGYVDIEEVNGKYFIVIMYNYSKIESYVEKSDLYDIFANMCNILSSIKYNDKVISTYVDSNKQLSQEEKFDIFSSKREKDNFLTYEKEYGVYNSAEVEGTQKDEDTIDLESND